MTQENLPESTYQLRAAVRTIMSPAVWLLTIIQAVLLVSMALFGGSENTEPVPGFPVFFSILVFGFVYMMSGLFRSFVVEKNIVTVQVAFNQGKIVFTSFIWLILRLLILFFLITNILFVVSGAQPAEVIKEGAKTFAFLVAILSFIFIYWLPIVFTASDFRLFKTLNTALLVAWDRIRQSLFLALMVLLPAMIAWLMPKDIPLPALVGIASINEIATWIAYVYCIEYLNRDKARIIGLLGLAAIAKDTAKDKESEQDQDEKDQEK
jgi:hypothetical protein